MMLRTADARIHYFDVCKGRRQHDVAGKRNQYSSGFFASFTAANPRAARATFKKLFGRPVRLQRHRRMGW
ncbi:hypothetical protein ACSAMZ_12550 [Xanthomonas citri pv. bilvae]|uniref:hypothetical protein n=1 Tax=Xanthomonas citri TaxID=346 RepID=UPI000A6EBA0E